MATKNLKKTETTRNGFGVKVKKCCASCQNKTIENDGTRVCGLMQLIMGQKDACPKWKASNSVEVAGMSGGKVKRKAYLMFVLAVRSEENEAIQKGIITEQGRKSLEQIREEFTKEHGSIYAIL